MLNQGWRFDRPRITSRDGVRGRFGYLSCTSCNAVFICLVSNGRVLFNDRPVAGQRN